MPTGTASILDGSRIASQIMQEVAEKVRHLALAVTGPDWPLFFPAPIRHSRFIFAANRKPARSWEFKVKNLLHRMKPAQKTCCGWWQTLNRRDDIECHPRPTAPPTHVDTKKLLLAVAPGKRCGRLSPVNIGDLVTRRPGLAPCTPSGIIELLCRNHIEIAGQHAVVVGRSDIVGRPMAILLLNHHATVTVCHSQTRDLAAITRLADILVVAIGRPAAITQDFVNVAQP